MAAKHKRDAPTALRVTSIALVILGGAGCIALGVLWLVAARRMAGDTSAVGAVGAVGVVGATDALAVLRVQAYVLLACGWVALVAAFLSIRGHHVVGGGLALLAVAVALAFTPRFIGVVLTEGVLLLGGVLTLLASAASSSARRW